MSWFSWFTKRQPDTVFTTFTKDQFVAHLELIAERALKQECDNLRYLEFKVKIKQISDGLSPQEVFRLP
jgi:hypothetical protein